MMSRATVAIGSQAASSAAAPRKSVVCAAKSRRELMLYSVNVGLLGALLPIGAAPRPTGLGVQDYGGGVKQLNLCPPTPNCVSTSEAANDPQHFVPAWTYDAKKTGKTEEQAMKELVQAVESTKPDGFTPKVVKQEKEYLYVEYESPTFGFIDDVEFWFKGNTQVEYRSASRIGESDGQINRKRIRALRKELEAYGWRSLAQL